MRAPPRAPQICTPQRVSRSRGVAAIRLLQPSDNEKGTMSKDRSLIRPVRRPGLLVPSRSGFSLRRRGMLGGLLGLSAGASLGGGCAAIAGEETIEAFFIVGKGTDADFDGWSEYNFDEPVDP